MKAVILAGGLGTRLAEETATKPKPMVEIGGRPILWHLLKHLSHHGINEFIICTGYKGYYITEFFMNFLAHTSDVTIDYKNQEAKYLNSHTENWKVTIIDTGLETGTGGRLRKVSHLLGSEDFLFTYGDGLSDLNIRDLQDFHKSHEKLATVTAVQPLGRFGNLEFSDGQVTKFTEKPLGDNGWVSGGFFILNPKVVNLIEKDSILWEKEPMQTLAKDRELMAFPHSGFWQGIDTLRDKLFLEELWNNQEAPWKLWT